MSKKFDIWYHFPNNQGAFEIGIGKYIKFNSTLVSINKICEMKDLCEERANILLELSDDDLVKVENGDFVVAISAKDVKADILLHVLDSDAGEACQK